MNMQQNSESGNIGHELWITCEGRYGRENWSWNVDNSALQEILNVQPEENNDRELVGSCEVAVMTKMEMSQRSDAGKKLH